MKNQQQQNTREDKEGKDAFTLTQQEFEELKNINTKIQVVFTIIVDKEIISKVKYSFETEEAAFSFAEDLSIEETGVPLDMWHTTYRDIAQVFVLDDPEGLFKTKYNITIYPVSTK